jgi:hypothetical protein
LISFRTSNGGSVAIDQQRTDALRQALQATDDPKNLFCLNQNIAPQARATTR